VSSFVSVAVGLQVVVDRRRGDLALTHPKLRRGDPQPLNQLGWKPGRKRRQQIRCGCACPWRAPAQPTDRRISSHVDLPRRCSRWRADEPSPSPSPRRPATRGGTARSTVGMPVDSAHHRRSPPNLSKTHARTLPFAAAVSVARDFALFPEPVDAAIGDGDSVELTRPASSIHRAVEPNAAERRSAPNPHPSARKPVSTTCAKPAGRTPASPRNHAPSRAIAGYRVSPSRFDGKEGVNGSSPLEGSLVFGFVEPNRWY
jgi:hypothetical protein